MAPRTAADRASETYAERTALPARRRPPFGPLLAAALLAVTAVVLVPGGPGGATAAAPRAASFEPMAATAAATSTWAWGAEANLSYAASYVGAFNASTAGATGNLTTTGAAVSLSESLGVRYAAYAVVNATTPSPGNLSLQLAAAEYRAMAITVAGSGDFPVAGVYNNSTLPPLSPRNVSLVASVEVLNAFAAFLNLTTGPNGSLALENEHVTTLRAVNLSLAAVDLPNVTRTAAGDVAIRYVTGSYSAQAYVAQDLNATFVPAVPLVRGPLFLGENWTATTDASFVGAAAYAARFSATIPGNGTASWGQSGTVSANATDRLTLDFSVVGQRTVYRPGGASQTDYEIAVTSSGGNASAYLVDGLVILPVADPAHAAGIPASVPSSAASGPTTTSDQPTSRSLVSTRSGLPDSQVSAPVAGSSVAAAPVAPATADAAIAALRAPTPTAERAAGPAVPAAAVGLGALLTAGFAVFVGFAVRREVRTLRGRP